MHLHTSIHLSPLVLSLLLVQLLFQFLKPKKKKISYFKDNLVAHEVVSSIQIQSASLI